MSHATPDSIVVYMDTSDATNLCTYLYFISQLLNDHRLFSDQFALLNDQILQILEKCTLVSTVSVGTKNQQFVFDLVNDWIQPILSWIHNFRE